MEFAKDFLKLEDAEPAEFSDISGSGEYFDISDAPFFSVLDAEDNIFNPTVPISQSRGPVPFPPSSRRTQSLHGWICRKCGQSYALVSQLSAHNCIRERKFECCVCKASFLQMATLKQHYSVHSVLRPFTCEVCWKSFSRKSTLISHRKIHGARKAFSCTICGKAFHQKGNLINHVHTHSNARPYKCGTCGKGFNQRSNLTCHLKKFHDENKENAASAVCDDRGARKTLPGQTSSFQDKPLRVVHQNGQDVRGSSAYNSLLLCVMPLFGTEGEIAGR